MIYEVWKSCHIISVMFCCAFVSLPYEYNVSPILSCCSILSPLEGSSHCSSYTIQFVISICTRKLVKNGWVDL